MYLTYTMFVLSTLHRTKKNILKKGFPFSLDSGIILSKTISTFFGTFSGDFIFFVTDCYQTESSIT